MPATALDWMKHWFPVDKWGGLSPQDATFCIIGGDRYMRQLQTFYHWRLWSIEDRHPMAQAAYNAGMGNISKARVKCSAGTWDETAPCLAAITGKVNAKQTTDYVTRIACWYRELQHLPP